MADLVYEKKLRRVVFYSTTIGTAIEQYDFLLFGILAASVFNTVFFPSFDPFMGTLASLATFSIGVVGRPIGGIIGGHFGDRVGRKTMLLLSLTVMGLSSTAIGLLPGYESIGVYAPILLVAFRLAQGVALGVEQAGASILAVEHSPARHRGLYGSFPIIGSNLGALMAFATLSAMVAIAGDSFGTWGWRVPFIASSLLLVFGYVIRSRLPETPAFEELKASGKRAVFPLLEVVRSNPKELLIAAVTRFGNFGWSTVILIVSITYTTANLSLPRSVILNAISAAALVGLFTTPAVGFLSDRYGRRPLIIVGGALMALFAWPYFLLLGTKDPTLITAAVIFGLAVITPLVWAVEASFFSEMFTAQVRFSGIAMGQQIGSVLSGVFVPMFAALALDRTGGDPFPIAMLCVGMGVAMVIAIAAAKETRGASLSVGVAKTVKRAEPVELAVRSTREV